MNSSLDLNLLLVARQAGVEKTELPDLYAVTPPRRTARGREADSLIIYLSLTGNSPLSPEAQAKLLEQLAGKFYKTTGSLTAAMRTIAESLNLYLLDRNLRSTSVGRQGIGQLILVALRADTVYIAQCGAVHTFLISPGATQPLHDLQSSGRGLGLSRTTPVRFIQVKMGPEDFLVISSQLAPGWTDQTLKHPGTQGIELIRRQMVENGNQEYNAVIVQAQAGTGKLRILRRKGDISAVAYPPAESPMATSTGSVSTLPSGVTASIPASDKGLGIPSNAAPVMGQPSVPAEDRRLGIPLSKPATPIPAPLESPLPYTAPLSAGQPPASTVYPVREGGEEFASTGIQRGESGKPVEAHIPQEIPQHPKPKEPSKPSPFAKFFSSFTSTSGAVLATIGRALRSALGTIGTALLPILKSLLPDADVLRLPPSMMVFVAIAIPLILATIGGMVYLQRGRAQQNQVYFKEAVKEAAYAVTLTNPLEQRLAWQAALDDIDKAESYAVNTQTQELRAQVIGNLDSLEAVKRLDYKQAIVDGLEQGTNVTRLVASATDLYLLNAAQGNVLHAIMTARGYAIDTTFLCGPTNGPINVGPLVDIAELPVGSFENASLLAMDTNGNLLYCVVGSQPYSATLAPPNTGFGEPTAISFDRGDLYVLDSKVNAVWIYRNMEVTQQPRLFFGDEIPPMQDVIDLAVYNDDLYLLHADGHVSKCTYSGLAESPTRCDDPYPYSDNRPGMVHGPVIEDTVFNQIYFSSFPERSIYMLDPQNQAIYYFSVLLNLQWQYKPLASTADGKATAFAISPNRTAFLAIGSIIYYAAMP